MMEKTSSARTRVSPRRTLRRASIRWAGQCERLARVLVLTRLPSRTLSRRRTAGGEPRLGTVAIYMRVNHTFQSVPVKVNLSNTCLHNAGQPSAKRGKHGPYMPFSCGNFGLERTIRWPQEAAEVGDPCGTLNCLHRSLQNGTHNRAHQRRRARDPPRDVSGRRETDAGPP